MGKALGIDYGTKRTGIAVTDALQLVASGLTTVATHTIEDFIEKLLSVSYTHLTLPTKA